MEIEADVNVRLGGQKAGKSQKMGGESKGGAKKVRQPRRMWDWGYGKRNLTRALAL